MKEQINIFAGVTKTRNKMKKFIFSMIFMLAPLAAAFAQDVVGKWKLEDGTCSAA